MPFPKLTLLFVSVKNHFMTKITTLTLFAFFISIISFAQSNAIKAQLLDSVTKQPIPFATIQLANKKGVISNSEGRFNIQLPTNTKAEDSLYISCIGYGSFTKPILTLNDSIIYLAADAIQLNAVVVSNKNYTAEEIITLIKDSITSNYSLELTKKRIFFRSSNFQTMDKTNYTFKKSTIDALNKPFLDSVLRSIPKKNDYYSEILCDLYGNHEEGNQKINMIKASKLYDKNKDLGLTALEEKFNKIIKENVKPDSYFKIKSGIIGTKVDSDEIFDPEEAEGAEAIKKQLEEEKKKEEKRKKNFANHKKHRISKILNSQFYSEDPTLNIIEKSNRYEFIIKDFTYVGEDPVYIVDFTPKRKEKFEGTIYVNADNFAIIRIDYTNVKAISSFSLLGLSYNEYMKKGTIFYTKDQQQKYYLSYFESYSGYTSGIKRPLTIIEKNKHVKGRRKQNELAVKLDFQIRDRNKYELVVFDSQALSKPQFDGFTENNTTLPTYMPQYDPSFWEGHNIMEPNQAIKNFKIE